MLPNPLSATTGGDKPVMTRIGRYLAVLAVAALVVSAAPISRADDYSLAYAALSAAGRGDWGEAHAAASEASDPVLSKLVLWLEATRTNGGASFTQITGFVIDNPDWPQQRTLRVRAEQALPNGASDQAVLAWFDRNEPLTLPGASRYADALIASGDDARAAQVARGAWARADAQTVEEEDAYYIRFANVLTEADHARRLDRLLWAGRISPAQRMLPRLGLERRALGEARIALRQSQDSGPVLAALVPAELQGDPGLVYDQARWYRRRDNDSTARQLLTTWRPDYAEPDSFWRERALLAREALSRGDVAGAYAVASEHGFVDGSERAEAEWLAGWIALRFLQQPDVAAPAFLTMFENVSHPVSRARGAYWSARAAQAKGDTDSALLWHKAAAQHGVAFYGQLSAAQIRPGEPLRLPPDPGPDAAEEAAFRGHELARAATLLAAAGDRDAQRTFLLRLAELGETRTWKNNAAALAANIGRPDIGVAIARQSIRGGMPLIGPGYPVIPAADYAQYVGVEAPLVLAIIRQESAFDLTATSPAGAQGLMQLMPGTARDVSAKLGIPYSPSSLIGSPEYNVNLGSSYIREMLQRFDGSYILALAAYNAGPSRVNQWIANNGDPRTSTEAAVDWIEMIPFGETRNYVQRCLENLQVYRNRAGVQLAQTLAVDLVR
jgi:soluble lytic murein transglycosylase